MGKIANPNCGEVRSPKKRQTKKKTHTHRHRHRHRHRHTHTQKFAGLSRDFQKMLFVCVCVCVCVCALFSPKSNDPIKHIDTFLPPTQSLICSCFCVLYSPGHRPNIRTRHANMHPNLSGSLPLTHLLWSWAHDYFRCLFPLLCCSGSCE